MKLEWQNIEDGNRDHYISGKGHTRLSVEKLQATAERKWLDSITGDDYVCPHDQIRYRAKTKDKLYAYMCGLCYAGVLNGIDHNTMGFTTIGAIKLKEYLEKLL